MRPLFSILTLLMLATSCKTPADKSNQPATKFDILPLPIDSSAFYFKTKVSWQDTTADALDTFVNTWYSKMLFALKEPILKDYSGDKEIYRFTWLRSFHHPVSIRIEKQGDIIKLFTKVSKGAGGYEPEEIITDNTGDVTLQEYNLLLEKINSTKFWSLPTEMQDGGTDGAEWIVEIIKNNRYHIVTRNTPFEERHGNFRIIGEYLILLSKLDKKETEHIY
ncbi:MAG: hypothetical protein ABIP79_02930 [Chitinophagaceae bacterium]